MHREWFCDLLTTINHWLGVWAPVGTQGLGIEIDEDALEDLLFDGFEPREAGKGPPREKMYPMEDGSAAEW